MTAIPKGTHVAYISARGNIRTGVVLAGGDRNSQVQLDPDTLENGAQIVRGGVVVLSNDWLTLIPEDDRLKTAEAELTGANAAMTALSMLGSVPSPEGAAFHDEPLGEPLTIAPKRVKTARMAFTPAQVDALVTACYTLMQVADVRPKQKGVPKFKRASLESALSRLEGAQAYYLVNGVGDHD